MSANTHFPAGFPALIVVGVYRGTGGFDNLGAQKAGGVPFSVGDAGLGSTAGFSAGGFETSVVVG